MVSTVRVALVFLALVVACLSGAIEARSETAPPVIELLQPAAGARIDTSLKQNQWLTYRVRVTFPADYEGSRALQFDESVDPTFSGDGDHVVSKICVFGVVVCDITYMSNSGNLPLGTRVYWRASIANTDFSRTQSFMTAGKPVSKVVADRDHDGIVDAKDNCPALRNPKQVDFEHDGKGDACQPDRKTPRVKAYSGHERRGQFAQFHWRAVDNRPVTIRLVLRWQGRAVLRGWMPNVQARLWGGVGDESQWESEKPIDASFPIGTYTFCISAQDAAGHKASSCAPYKITA